MITLNLNYSIKAFTLFEICESSSEKLDCKFQIKNEFLKLICKGLRRRVRDGGGLQEFASTEAEHLQAQRQKRRTCELNG